MRWTGESQRNRNLWPQGAHSLRSQTADIGILKGDHFVRVFPSPFFLPLYYYSTHAPSTPANLSFLFCECALLTQSFPPFLLLLETLADYRPNSHTALSRNSLLVPYIVPLVSHFFFQLAICIFLISCVRFQAS